MSRYNIEGYAYGFDYPLSEYFLSKGSKTLVGIMSRPHVHGDHVNLITALKREGLWDKIPASHQQAIIGDLPF